MYALSPYIPLLIIALIVAVLRFRVPSVKPDFSPTGVLKVAAHFLVAGLFGYSWGARDWVPAIVGGALTAVEILAFVIHKPEAVA